MPSSSTGVPAKEFVLVSHLHSHVFLFTFLASPLAEIFLEFTYRLFLFTNLKKNGWIKHGDLPLLFLVWHSYGRCLLEFRCTPLKIETSCLSRSVIICHPHGDFLFVSCRRSRCPGNTLGLCETLYISGAERRLTTEQQKLFRIPSRVPSLFTPSLRREGNSKSANANRAFCTQITELIKRGH